MRTITVSLTLENSDGRKFQKTYSINLDNIAFIKQDMNLIHGYMGHDISREKYNVFL